MSEFYPLAGAPAFQNVLPGSIFQVHCLHGGPTCQHRWITRGSAVPGFVPTVPPEEALRSTRRVVSQSPLGTEACS